jgi:hypothetical protein
MVCAMRHRLANAAEANNPECLSGNSVTKQMRGTPPRPRTTSEFVVAFPRPPRNGQHEEDRQIRCVFREHPWRIGYREPETARDVEINVVKPDAKIGEQFNTTGARLEDCRRHGVGQCAQQDIGVTHRAHQGAFIKLNIIDVE